MNHCLFNIALDIFGRVFLKSNQRGNSICLFFCVTERVPFISSLARGARSASVVDIHELAMSLSPVPTHFPPPVRMRVCECNLAAILVSFVKYLKNANRISLWA